MISAIIREIKEAFPFLFIGGKKKKVGLGGMLVSFPWRKSPPENDGEYFFSGYAPNGSAILAVVQVFTIPGTDIRGGVYIIPAGWRGDQGRKDHEYINGSLDQWRGLWAGPEYGLSCALLGGSR